MSSAVSIYALSDPRTREVRYVGKTTDPRQRLRQHSSDSRGRITPTKAWLRSLRRDGLTPIMQVLETCTADAWEERERHHIARLRAEGCRLTNLAEGGNQPLCSPEVRRANAALINGGEDRPIFALVRAMWQHVRDVEAKGGRADAQRLAIARIKTSSGEARQRLRDYAKSKGYS